MSEIKLKRESTDQYLTFLLGDDEYGINIEDVIEIVGIQKITTIPEQPSYVNGVINLRGRIIPVIDVRTRFGIKKIDYDERTCIVVVNYLTTYVGFIVDRVREVNTIDEKDISEPPEDSLKSSGEYIKGIATNKENMVVIIDGKMLIDIDEIKKTA